MTECNFKCSLFRENINEFSLKVWWKLPKKLFVCLLYYSFFLSRCRKIFASFSRPCFLHSLLSKNAMFFYATGGREAVKKIAQIAEVMTFPVQKKERRRKNWRRRETEKWSFSFFFAKKRGGTVRCRHFLPVPFPADLGSNGTSPIFLTLTNNIAIVAKKSFLFPLKCSLLFRSFADWEKQVFWETLGCSLETWRKERRSGRG